MAPGSVIFPAENKTNGDMKTGLTSETNNVVIIVQSLQEYNLLLRMPAHAVKEIHLK